MRKDRKKALTLRLSGRSYKSIQRELGIPISTLSSWFRNKAWSEAIKNKLSVAESLTSPHKVKLMAQANQERWQKIRDDYRVSAEREFQKLKQNPLFLAGTILYWAEGEKHEHSSLVRFGSGDPQMVKLFCLFLKKTLKLDGGKIKARLILYPDLIENVQLNLWSRMISIPLPQFKRSAYIKSRRPSKRFSAGTCTVYIQSRALKERMLQWLELYQIHLQSHAMTLEK